MLLNIIIGALVIVILAGLLSSYKKVGPNEVLIVTGGMLHGPYVQENKDTHTRMNYYALKCVVSNDDTDKRSISAQ